MMDRLRMDGADAMPTKKTAARAQTQKALQRAARAGSASQPARKVAPKPLRSAAGKASKGGKATGTARRPAKPRGVKSIDLATILSADHLTLSRGQETLELPSDVISALRKYVKELTGGGSPRLVAVTDNGATLSSQQAADLLNVSRPFVVKLARTGQLKHTKTGNRHRFALQDVLEYDGRARRERDESLRDIVPASGYDDGDF